MKTTKLILGLIVTLACSAAYVGCGSSNSGNTTSSGTSVVVTGDAQ